MEKITKSENETFEFAREYAHNLKGGEVIGLSGDLGAGKTVFTKGLAAGLNIKQTVTSPTFVIMKIYGGKKIKLVHIDAYRLESERDLEAIGAAEYFGGKNTVVVIEWAEKIKNFLPSSTFYVKINNQEADNRKIIIKN